MVRDRHWQESGDTSCILTDVKGFRDVLHSALVFHALVHEFHELDSEFHANLPELKLKLDKLLSGIYSRIYRGDNSVDVRTCKCHAAHFHSLTWAIKYFGSPMGYDAAKGERNLKFWAEEMSKTARKCGQAIFMEQTSKRVTDHLVLQQANNIILADAMMKKVTNDVSVAQEDSPPWAYTRKKAHLIYNMGDGKAEMIECTSKKPPAPFALLTPKRNSCKNLLWSAQPRLFSWY